MEKAKASIQQDEKELQRVSKDVTIPTLKEKAHRASNQKMQKDVDKVSKVLHNINISRPSPKAEKLKSAREQETD